MDYCEWCKKLTSNLTNYMSTGTGIQYTICDKCLGAVENDICIRCESTIAGKDIAGLCVDCAQEDSAIEQQKISEIIEGVNIDLLQEYTSEVVFTEDDYERWVTFSQKAYTKEQIRKNRIAWLKTKLSQSPDWTPERIDRNVDALSSLVDKYASNLLKQSYLIMYYPEKPEPGYKVKRPTAAILDRVGDIILIEL